MLSYVNINTGNLCLLILGCLEILEQTLATFIQGICKQTDGMSLHIFYQTGKYGLE
jgi:hypothetical protein